MPALQSPKPLALGDGGIVVSIAAFQAVYPGSIPGHRRCLFSDAKFWMTPLLGCFLTPSLPALT